VTLIGLKVKSIRTTGFFVSDKSRLVKLQIWSAGSSQ